MKSIKNFFYLKKGITYLNHGSFGACPKVIFKNYQKWQVKLETQPVKFLTDELYIALRNSRESLSAFLGCKDDEILFFQNPTTAISNIIYNLDLAPYDEVLMTNHGMNALVRAWDVWGKKWVTIKNINQSPFGIANNFLMILQKNLFKNKVLFISLY